MSWGIEGGAVILTLRLATMSQVWETVYCQYLATRPRPTLATKTPNTNQCYAKQHDFVEWSYSTRCSKPTHSLSHATGARRQRFWASDSLALQRHQTPDRPRSNCFHDAKPSFQRAKRSVDLFCLTGIP